MKILSTTPKILERRLVKILEAHHVQRPLSSIFPFLGNLRAVMAALPQAQSAPIPLDLHLMITTIFHDWGYWREELEDAWSQDEFEEAKQLLGSLLDLNPPPTPLPSFPVAPLKDLKIQELIHVLWLHMDHLGLRIWILLVPLKLERYLEPGLDPVRLLQDAIALAEQATQLLSPGWTEHAVDLEQLVQGMMTRLSAAHRGLDALEHRAPKAKQAVLHSLPLKAPLYRVPPALFNLEEDSQLERGELPKDLAQALSEGIQVRKSVRPLESLIPLVRRYVCWKEILDEEWHWIPEIDGREVAILIFETVSAAEKPWNLAQARRFSVQADHLHRYAAGPLGALPAVDEQVLSDDSGILLWQHLDAMTLAFSLGLVTLGVLPTFDEVDSTEDAEVAEMFASGLALLTELTARWHRTPAAQRGELRTDAATLFGMFSTMLRELLEPFCPAILDLVPELAMPEPPRKTRAPRKIQKLRPRK